MNAATYNNSQSGTGLLTGTGVVPQLLLAVVTIFIIYIVMLSFEQIYSAYKRYDKAVTELMPLTYSAENKSYTISQDPTDKSALPITFSDNERTGLEFSYSFYIFVNPSTFQSGQEGLAHVFHKGYSRPYPLLGPGVFMKTNENTMRVYMNCTNEWNSYIDVENFPVQKWVHMALVARDNGIEVYVNGDLKKRLHFKKATPYQNFGNFYAFSQRNFQLACDRSQGSCTIKSLKGEPYIVKGAMSGLLSRLRHFNYALSYTEINDLVHEGPNSKMEGQDQDKPPYLADTWWTTP
jgi:hypothetical protein